MNVGVHTLIYRARPVTWILWFVTNKQPSRIFKILTSCLGRCTHLISDRLDYILLYKYNV